MWVVYQCKIRQVALSKIRKCHLISWNGHFLETHSFRRISYHSPETLQELCISKKCPHQFIAWNFCVSTNDERRFDINPFANIANLVLKKGIKNAVSTLLDSKLTAYSLLKIKILKVEKLILSKEFATLLKIKYNVIIAKLWQNVIFFLSTDIRKMGGS